MYRSRSAEKQLYDRMIFGVFGGILVIFLAVFYWIIAVDSDYRAVLDPVEMSYSEELCTAVSSVAEPADAYYTTVFTFGGSCTPASMLGSRSFGTFNLMYSEKGADYFFDGLDSIFSADNFTLVGCSAVLSDNKELTAADKGVFEWYLGPASNAEVFSAGSVEGVSLECARSGDYGEIGKTESEAALSSCGVIGGTDVRHIEVPLEGGGCAVICCLTYRNGNEAELAEHIGDAASKYDAVLVYITDSADSYAVSDAKRAAYRSFVDAGADVIVGTNGTKLQQIEEYNGKTIAYSLGALLDGSTKYPEKYSSLLRVNIRVDGGAVIGVSCESVPVVSYDENNSWRPTVIGEGEVLGGVEAFLCGERDNPN